MDDVVDLFQSMEAANNSAPVTNFQDLYKNCGRLGNQNERRKNLLERQKHNRDDNVDRNRGILDLVNEVEERENRSSYNQSYYRPSIYVAGFHKVARSYRNILMYSEWLNTKPDDFSENWYIVPCPKGVRVLVVASRGVTQCYTKYGQHKLKSSTALPGGNKQDKNSNPCCVLDCFYVEKSSSLYVLDVLAWNNLPMTDCETEFRHYWMKSKFAEHPELDTLTKKNKLIFKLLPKVPCDTQLLNEFLLKHPVFENNVPELDGYLFYHKLAHYVSGETPLVGWLYPFMVKEILGEDLTLHNFYVAATPIDYVDQTDFIQRFEMKNAKKLEWQRKRSTNPSENETTDPEMETDVTEVGGSGDATVSENKKNESKDDNIETDNSPPAENMEGETDINPLAENMEGQTDISPQAENMEGQLLGNLLQE